MHSCDQPTPDALYPFDARGIAKRFRHAAIFGAFDALMPGETATASTWVAEAPEGPRFDRFVRIDGPDGAMCAQARTVWCMIEQSTGRPKRVTPDIVARFI